MDDWKWRLQRRLPWLRDWVLTARTAIYGPERLARQLLRRAGRPGLAPRLHVYGRKVYSQNDEDGILAQIFATLGPVAGTFVEIGVSPPRNGRPLEVGLECNCRLLAERGWRGLYLDGGEYPAELGVTRAFVTAENINQLLDEHGVPDELDLFSLDIDGNDYWVWRALDRRPRVVIVEYNANLARDESKTIVYDPRFDWAAQGCTKYYGASLLALERLGRHKGYTLVYANRVNAFFVETRLLPNAAEFDYHALYRGADHHAPLRGDEVWVEIPEPGR